MGENMSPRCIFFLNNKFYLTFHVPLNVIGKKGKLIYSITADDFKRSFSTLPHCSLHEYLVTSFY